MPNNMLKNCYAVILCGGRGTRMGQATEDWPKSMVTVRSKPLIDYIINALIDAGLRKFILPLGFKGEVIRQYVTETFGGSDCEFLLEETGDDAAIASRLGQIAHIIPADDNFLLLNGDAIFNFELSEMFNKHIEANAWVTFSSVEVLSKYGLIFEKDGQVINFNRDARVDQYHIADAENTCGYIYSGIAWLNKKIFELFDPNTCENFEWEVYPKVIERKKAAHWVSSGDWYAIDTQKDLETIEKNFESLLPTVKV